jgi:hypothetical protein
VRSFQPVLLVFCCAAAFAQPRKEPFLETSVRPSTVRPLPPGLRGQAITAPREYRLQPLTRAEQALLNERSLLPRTGIHRRLPAEAVARGSWDTTADGGSVWRLVVRSPGSTGTRIQFRDFAVGSGQVWLHDGVHAFGPYTSEGIFGNGEFWSDTVFSEAAVIEYQPQDPSSRAVPFRIAKIVHQTPVHQAAVRQAPPEVGGDPVLFATSQSPKDTADICHMDPNCYPDWQSSMKSVAQIIFEEGEFEALCSGALVATRNNNLKPYFMTAGHCVSTEEAARSVEAYWTYQTAQCGGPLPDRASSTKSSPGAHLLTSGALNSGDFSLLLLKDVPAGVAYAGWDPSEPPLAAPLVGIHHPHGSYKRISFGHRVGDTYAVIDNLQSPPQDYYQVQWDKGRTEPGSSGSPLFSGPGVVVGALTYGPASPNLTACEISPSVDGYGRFSVAYPSMRDYLEDLPASTVSPQPASVQVKGLNGQIPAGALQTINLTTLSPNPVVFKARADAPWIRLSAASGNVSAGAPAKLDVGIDPQYLAKTGTYTSTVTITSGAADPQFLNVKVEMTVQRSVVAVSFTPSTVFAQPAAEDGARWNFQVKLEEKAGVGTTITGLRINGTDYSSSIEAFFGGTHLDGNSSLTASLRGSGVFAAGDQYFEVTGTDDGSGQSWYQSATVRFLE